MGLRRGSAAALALVALSAGCGGGTKTVTVVQTHTVTTTRTMTKTSSAQLAACTGLQLSGKFAEVPGSAGAGQVEYLLTLKDTSGSGCWMGAAPPAVRLVGADGSLLPSRVVPAKDVTRSTPPVRLEPGTAATATVRFSPDVAGSGDSQSGPCQPKAHTLEVTATGGGRIEVSIQPPTSVCERGTLDFDVLKRRS